MASTCLRSLNRSSLSSLRSHVSKANIAGRRPPPTNSSTAGYARTATGADAGTAFHSPIHRFRALSRWFIQILSFRPPVELGSCAGSMYPLHSAVAAARLTSRLSFTSRSCRDISQGTLCRTSPGL
ncbi:hypothetical protein MA16_Dca010668 [Dendrobium catenatum]|uniref:Protein NUCLEAR FUSION DEFECTIVE 6, chloroplastic/mitochondrial n=1 Tax=Dendrobium catenatum TaxID=906689 RepID=A0A2I0VK20_9ASPA|nr:hypothetical protein MA16_Dca010668 [Dendrobium catenatum]